MDSLSFSISSFNLFCSFSEMTFALPLLSTHFKIAGYAMKTLEPAPSFFCKYFLTGAIAFRSSWVFFPKSSLMPISFSPNGLSFSLADSTHCQICDVSITRSDNIVKIIHYPAYTCPQEGAIHSNVPYFSTDLVQTRQRNTI